MNDQTQGKAAVQPFAAQALASSDTLSERLELYRVMVDTVTANEARRQQMMTVYVSLVVGGFAAMGSIDDFDPLYFAIPALPLSLIWWSSLRYFRALATAKFSVIDHLEKGFSFQPFAMEWKNMRRQEPSLSVLEMTLPATTAVASGVYLLFRYLSIP